MATNYLVNIARKGEPKLSGEIRLRRFAGPVEEPQACSTLAVDKPEFITA
jgi:hypothetical protein